MSLVNGQEVSFKHEKSSWKESLDEIDRLRLADRMDLPRGLLERPPSPGRADDVRWAVLSFSHSVSFHEGKRWDSARLIGAGSSFPSTVGIALIDPNSSNEILRKGMRKTLRKEGSEEDSWKEHERRSAFPLGM